MNGRFLLDTNIIIALFAEDPTIHEHIVNMEEVFIPCIAIGELYFGAYKSSKIKENLIRIDEFALNNTVLSCDLDTAKRYGNIKSRLKEKAQPIPENDIMTYGLRLLLNNTLLLWLHGIRILKL